MRVLPPIVFVCVLHIVGTATADELTAAVEAQRGVPTLVVNGRPTPPLLFWHRALGGTVPLSATVGTQWRQFEVSFTACTSDDNIGLHVTNPGQTGSWWVDDVDFLDRTAGTGQRPNRVRNGRFEEGPEGLKKDWTFFVASGEGAKASSSLDTRKPASGRACLRVDVENAGSAAWRVHLYQGGHKIESGKTYVFRMKLRADRQRRLNLKVVRQGPPWTVYGGQPPVIASEVRLSRDAGFHIRSFGMTIPWPRGGQPPDYSAVDTQMRMHLAIDPAALVVPRVHTDAPKWWKEEHADHVMLYDYGRRRMVSVASEPWRRDAEAALRLLVRHLEDKFGQNVLGYHVAGQSAGEWFYDWTWTKIMPNFETPFRDGFRRWLQEKYKTDDALRAAWSDPKAGLDSVQVPTLAERTEARHGSFRDVKSQRRVIDFFDYNQVAIVEPMEIFCRAVKQECKRRKLVIAFYSYLFDVAGFAYGPQVSGHLATDRVLRCSDIDALASPISYFDRQAGGSGPFMAPVDSIQLHGKMWIIEDDTRTYLTHAGTTHGRVGTPEGTRWVHDRNFAPLLTHHCGMWWMDLGVGWLDGRDLWENAARLRTLWTKLAPARELSKPDIAVIVDERSSLYLPCGNVVTRPLMYTMRRQLNRTGASVGYYLLSDLCAGRVPDAKLYVLLNSFAVSSGQREAIHRQVRRDGKWSLWFYAPGYVDPDGDRGDMAALTGLPLERVAGPRPPEVTVAGCKMFEPVVDADQRQFGKGPPLETLFRLQPNVPGVEVLGHYQGTTDVALGLRRRQQWTSVFCGSTTISTGVLRQLARAAGCHVWLDTPDVLIASRALVAVHADRAGKRTLSIPRGVVLQDTSTGKTYREKAPLEFRGGQTRIFLVGEESPSGM